MLQSQSAAVSAMTMSCDAPSIAVMATAKANERATLSVNVSYVNITRVTAKLRKKYPDEALFPLLVVS